MSSITTKSKPYPKVISVVNLKGGVGKTTLSVNLAYGIAYFLNKRVLLVDLDPQANATQYLLPQLTYRNVYLSDPPKRKTVVDLYLAHVSNILGDYKPIPDPQAYLQRVYKGSRGYLDLVASKLQLSVVAFREGHAQTNDQVRWLIDSISDNYDYVLIDAPPTVSRMLIAAFEASESILVPVKPDFLSSIGLPLLSQVITTIYNRSMERRPRHWKPLQILGLVFTMYDARLTMTAESVEEIQKVADELHAPIFKSVISNSTKFAWSSQKSLPIFRTEPRSRYALEIEALVNEFIAYFESIESSEPNDER